MRTTQVVEVLTTREGWALVRARAAAELETQPDPARDLETNVRVDVLFSRDDGDMAFPLPDAAEASELDASRGARFMGLLRLVELESAVYLAKRREYGPEVAAEDLADVVELVRNNRDAVTAGSADSMHPSVRRLLRRVVRRVDRAARSRRR